MRATDRLSLVFGALSDPTRRDIVTRLSHASTTVGELAGEYRISAPAVSQHLNVLERAGLVTRTTRAQWRTVALRTEPLDGDRVLIVSGFTPGKRIVSQGADLLDHVR